MTLHQQTHKHSPKATPVLSGRDPRPIHDTVSRNPATADGVRLPQPLALRAIDFGSSHGLAALARADL
jgi:hypothetical protein